MTITGHGARSITGVEVGLDPLTVTEKQLEAIPGIGKKSAWKRWSVHGPNCVQRAKTWNLNRGWRRPVFH